MAVARKIDTGICYINGPTVADEAQIPFGGTKASGYGRFGGKGGDRRVHRAPVDHERRTAVRSELSH